MIAMEELLSLKWNNHRSTFLHILAVLRDKELYTDVIIACDGKFYNVHKLVLSTCSDYFSTMFDKTAGKSPIIVLKDIKSEDLEALLDYMYLGEVNVRQSDLASLIKSAECLRIKGLAVPDDEPPKKLSNNRDSKRNDSSSSSPHPKRKRREEDSRDDVRPSKLPSPSPSSKVSSAQLPSPMSKRPLPSPSHDEKQRHSPNLQLPTDNSIPSDPSESPYNIQEVPYVKQEVEDQDEEDIQQAETYDLTNDGYKEEVDDTADLSNDLPEFLQASSSSFPQSSFPGTSSYQPDMSSWQDQNFSGMNFGGTSQEGSQNAGVKTQDGHHKKISAATLEELQHSFQTDPSTSHTHVPYQATIKWHSPKFDVTPSLTELGEDGTLTTKYTRNPSSSPINISLDSKLQSQTSINSDKELSQCNECGKVFKGSYKKYNLQKHMTIHKGLRPYVCPICKSGFNQKSSMQRHLLGVHYKAYKALDYSTS